MRRCKGFQVVGSRLDIPREPQANLPEVGAQSLVRGWVGLIRNPRQAYNTD